VKDFYNLSQKSYDSLIKSGVTITQMFKATKLFDPYGQIESVGVIGLLYYLDNKKTIQSGSKFPHRTIAQAVFNTLSIKDKIAVAEYEELVENNFEDEDDE